MKKRQLLAIVLTAILLVSTLAMAGILNVFAAETTISTAEEFKAITGDGNYKLTNDIDLSGASFATIGSFSGTLDGNGKTIKGIDKPLFHALSGTVKNLTLEGAITTDSSASVGVLANTVSANLTLDSVTNKANVTAAKATGVSGLVGAVSGTPTLTVTKCTNEGNLAGLADVGGLIGQVMGKSGTEHAVVTITSALNTGSASMTTANKNCGVGGIIGAAAYYTIEVTKSENLGDISYTGGDSGVAGILGGSKTWANSNTTKDIFTAKYCVNHGNITGTNARIGGITGRMNRDHGAVYTYEYCYNTGAISGGASSSGITGYTNVKASVVAIGCYNIGVLEGDATYPIGTVNDNTSTTSASNNFAIGTYNTAKASVAATIVDSAAALNEQVVALGEYILVNGIDHPIFKWQCPHQKTVTTLTAEYCKDCSVKVREIEDTSLAFDNGTISETADNSYTISTEGISSFISYRSGSMGGTRDLRFVMALDIAKADTYDYVKVNVTFYDEEENLVKVFTFTQKDLAFYRSATGAGNTYVAAEGDALFGIVIKGVPLHAWKTATLSVEVAKNTVYAGSATNSMMETDGNEIGVMTFNLRYDISSHALMALDVRGPHLMEIIDKYDPDSVGFNEATNNWMNWLRGNMASRGYAYVGVGRDSAADNPSATGNSNEYSPIFYKADKYDLLESGTFWLSKTPTTKSKGWGSGYNRICTFAVLKNKETGEIYAHFSAHLDHKDMEAQENSVYIIETYVRAMLEKYGNIGIVVSGDFNTVEFEPNNPSYDAATYNAATAFLDDTRYLATDLGVVGKSFMGYDPEQWEKGYETDKDKPNIDTSAAPIDFIFVKKGAYTSSYYTVVNDTFTFDHSGKTWHNHPVSDHYGIYAKVTFANKEVGFVKDNTNLVDYKATISTTKPAGLTGVLTNGFTLISTFDAKDTDHAITNLLKDDNSTAKISVAGSIHGYWEITFSAYAEMEVSGLSFTTASGTLPYNFKVLVSSDGTNWKQVGAAYDEKLTAGTTYYIKPEELIKAQYVRLAFTDTPDGAELQNVSLYAISGDNGRVYPEQITTTAGPSFGGSEGCQNLFDGTNSKKYYNRQYSEGSVPANPDPMDAIFFETDVAVTITHYTMINANDTASHTGRLPRQWTLYGSTDGENYVVIDTVTSPSLPTANYATKSFTVDNPGSYQYYKLVFVCGTTGNVQFSEMELYETVS